MRIIYLLPALINFILVILCITVLCINIDAYNSCTYIWQYVFVDTIFLFISSMYTCIFNCKTQFRFRTEIFYCNTVISFILSLITIPICAVIISSITDKCKDNFTYTFMPLWVTFIIIFTNDIVMLCYSTFILCRVQHFVPNTEHKYSPDDGHKYNTEILT